jgi:hypothetical protein
VTADTNGGWEGWHHIVGIWTTSIATKRVNMNTNLFNSSLQVVRKWDGFLTLGCWSSSLMQCVEHRESGAQSLHRVDVVGDEVGWSILVEGDKWVFDGVDGFIMWGCQPNCNTECSNHLGSVEWVFEALRWDVSIRVVVPINPYVTDGTILWW